MCCLMHAAAAVACGGTVGGPIVSHGSLPGQRWAQRACSDGPRLLDVETDLPQVGYDDGGGMQVPFPLSAHVLYIDVPYEKYGTGREDGVTGVTALDVRRLKFDFRRGPSSNVYPHLAPAAGTSAPSVPSSAALLRYLVRRRPRNPDAYLRGSDARAIARLSPV